MIDLTPLEVRKKKDDLPRVFRGYDPGRVDDFLELVADRLEQLVRENRSLTEEREGLERQLKDYRDREKALTESLLSAQTLREQWKQQATADADVIRRLAEVEAAEIRAEAVQSRQKEEEAIRELRARRSQLVGSYRSFLERELAELAIVSERLQLHGDEFPPSPPLPIAAATRPRAEPPPAPPEPQGFDLGGLLGGAADEEEVLRALEALDAIGPGETPEPPPFVVGSGDADALAEIGQLDPADAGESGRVPPIVGFVPEESEPGLPPGAVNAEPGDGSSSAQGSGLQKDEAVESMFELEQLGPPASGEAESADHDEDAEGAGRENDGEADWLQSILDEEGGRDEQPGGHRPGSGGPADASDEVDRGRGEGEEDRA